MQTIIRTIVILLCPILLPSCSNALYFYETDKVSLTVDARPDSSQPVQGNLGIKQRVALVTPATKSLVEDALSSISSFRFKIAEEPGFNPVTIQSAFITGDAASCLNQKQTENAASILALSGELEKQNVAIGKISTLSKVELEQLFICFGYPNDRAQNLAKRYEGLTEDTFKTKFKSDFRFEAESMLNKYNQCTENKEGTGKCTHQ